MKKTLRFLRYSAGLLILVSSLALLYFWWIARQTLPQLDGTVVLPELQQEVTVLRDRWGVPHIRAASLTDLVAAQGYVTAQDRLWQMDILRRYPAGELAEIFGPQALPTDRENRTYRFTQAAEREVAQLDAAGKELLEAYARGVNRYIKERAGNLPIEFQVLRYQPREWTPRDTLLIGASMHKFLTDTWRRELNRLRVTQKLGPELARELFIVDSPLDHFLVGKAAAPERKQAPAGKASRAKNFSGEIPAVAAPLDFLRSWQEDVEQTFGSNNWVVSGQFTYSGKPLLANDTHMMLDVPAIWYLVQLSAPGWNVKGFSLPGGPLVTIGHNERIAWGFTNNGADVQDLYVETFNPANANEYRVNGEWKAAEVRTETIRVKGQKDDVLKVQVTRHGPVMHREGNTGYALRWTALEPGGLNFAYHWLGQAQNWKQFLEVMRRVPGPAQNAVYADVDGNIGYVMASKIPVRKNGLGEVPMPGDSDDFEWTGYIPFEELPQVFNPPEGIIASANARVVGPGYRWHLTDRWEAPYRTDRIYNLLSGRQKLRPDDFIAIQTDLVSAPHRMLAAHVIHAAQKIPPADPRVADLMVHLQKWNGRATAESTETAVLEYTRRALRKRILEGRLGGDFRLFQWPRGDVFLLNLLESRPAHWLPKEFSSSATPSEGYDRLLLACVEDAVRDLEEASGRTKLSDWPWGRFNLLEMNHPLASSGFLQRHLSIKVAQPGTPQTVKQTGRSFGPSMRFVADLSNADNSLLNITFGQSGQYLSPHYRDQFIYWFEGKGIPSPFSDVAWERAAVHRLKLAPRAP